ncbi:MAG: histidine ammonia-lyase [Bacillota bacterium]
MITLDGFSLTLDDFVKVARYKEPVKISSKAKEAVRKSRRVVQHNIEQKNVVYGINTGFGNLANVRIADSDFNALQRNLVVSHACGTGEPFDSEIVRGMMVLRVNALIKGYSGIRLEVIDKLVDMLNRDVIPVVYEQGSLGASGDLVPLAHMALPLIGEGEVDYDGKTWDSLDAFRKAGIEPLDALQAKEGLALINGTQAMLSVGALTLYDGFDLYLSSLLSSGLTFEALNGIIDVFDRRIHEARPHKGQSITAMLMRRLLEGSKNTRHQGEGKVQDAYSLRCIPQVHGATLETLLDVLKKVQVEMNSATDNPLMFVEDEKAISAGNFHGEILAMYFDYLAIALSEIASISERRLERLVNAGLNHKYPPFLAKYMGRNSGFMIVQYSAASLVSENKALAHPASVDSIPSSGNQEDHVSMGSIAARKARKILSHSRKVVALEMFCAAQALDFDGKSSLSPVLKAVYESIRKDVPFIEEDTYMKRYMDRIERMLIDHTMHPEKWEAMLWDAL